MGNRQYKVHITYKHDELHNSGIEAICAGLHTRNIPFSIDKYDILYRDNIQRMLLVVLLPNGGRKWLKIIRIE